LVTNVTHSANTEIDIRIAINADTTNHYSRVGMTGNGSATASFSVTTDEYVYVLAASTTISTGLINFMDYSATDKHKTVLYRGNLTAGRVSAGAVRWPNTNAITSLVVSVATGNFNSGSTFALYGIVS
jgi:hypothetical protein